MRRIAILCCLMATACGAKQQVAEPEEAESEDAGVVAVAEPAPREIDWLAIEVSDPPRLPAVATPVPVADEFTDPPARPAPEPAEKPAKPRVVYVKVTDFTGAGSKTQIRLGRPFPKGTSGALIATTGGRLPNGSFVVEKVDGTESLATVALPLAALDGVTRAVLRPKLPAE